MRGAGAVSIRHDICRHIDESRHSSLPFPRSRTYISASFKRFLKETIQENAAVIKYWHTFKRGKLVTLPAREERRGTLLKNRTPVARRIVFALSLPELSLLAIVGWHLMVLQQKAATVELHYLMEHNTPLRRRSRVWMLPSCSMERWCGRFGGTQGCVPHRWTAPRAPGKVSRPRPSATQRRSVPGSGSLHLPGEGAG